MRWASTKALSNATVTVYGATVGPEQWSRIDNMSLHTTPGSMTFGTDCVEPGGTLLPAPAPAPAPLLDPARYIAWPVHQTALAWRPDVK
jgi:hypothetical protein